MECEFGYMPNESRNTCIPCKRRIDVKFSKGGTLEKINLLCEKCPNYTEFSRGNYNKNYSSLIKSLYDSNKEVQATLLKKLYEVEDYCYLNNILIDYSKHIKISLYKLKDKVKELCLEENELCYNSNKFLGPIVNGNSLFFLSMFEPSSINITDFSFYTKTKHLTQGHIFALIKEENLVDSSEIKESTSRFKRLLNIGSQISSVQIVPIINISKKINIKNTKSDLNVSTSTSSSNSTRMLFEKKNNKINGVIINFSNGEKCLSNENLYYSSVILLQCNSKIYSSIPTFNYFDKNNCKFYFTWVNRSACQYCTTDKMQTFNTREVSF